MRHVAGKMLPAFFGVNGGWAETRLVNHKQDMGNPFKRRANTSMVSKKSCSAEFIDYRLGEIQQKAQRAHVH